MVCPSLLSSCHEKLWIEATTLSGCLFADESEMNLMMNGTGEGIGMVVVVLFWLHVEHGQM